MRSGGGRMNGAVALVRGVYVLMTGLWLRVSIGTFHRVTGLKVDLWVVNTVGVMVTVIDGQHSSEVMPSGLGGSHRTRGPSGYPTPHSSNRTRPLACAGAV